MSINFLFKHKQPALTPNDQLKYTVFVVEPLQPMNPNPRAGSLQEFRVQIVRLILDGRAEVALGLLSKHYGVREPTLRIGTVKRHRKVVACYVEKEKRIYLSNSSFLTSPFVLLHEFYHHLRASQVDKSRQVEKRADLFAATFIREFASWKTLMRGNDGDGLP